MATAVDLPPSGSGIPGITVTGTPSIGQVLTATSPSAADWETPSGTSPDATSSVKGVLKLAACLGGTASLPTVVNLVLPSEAQGDLVFRDSTAWARLGAGTSGQFLKTQGAAANPIWASLPSAPDADASTKGIVQLTNCFGGTAALPTVVNLVMGSDAQGDIIYRGASAYVRLGAGTSGQYLKTQGASANPVWATFPSTDASTLGLIQLTNCLGGTAASPTVVNLVIPSEARGDLFYRGASAWIRLAKGTTGQALIIGANDPAWGTDFGANSLVTTGSVSVGTTPSTAVGFNTPNNTVALSSRNSTGLANQTMISSDAFGGMTVGTGMANSYVTCTGGMLMAVGTNTVNLSNGTSTIGINIFNTTPSPTITHTARAADVACTAFTITSQGPWASATSTNRNPGNLVFVVPAAASGGAEGKVQFSVAGVVQGAFVSGGLEVGTSPAQSGTFRAPGGANVALSQRTQAGTGDLALVSTDTSNNATFGNSSAPQTNLIASGMSVFVTTTGIQFIASATSPKYFQQQKSGNAAANDLGVVAQAAAAAATGANKNGGNLWLGGGARIDTAGRRGASRMAMNGSATEILVEAGDVQAEATSPSRVLSLLRNAAISATEMPTGTGDLVMYIGNAAVVPSANPVSGGILYMDAGALKFRGTSGTVTTIAAA